jgi:hypothetical protein
MPRSTTRIAARRAAGIAGRVVAQLRDLLFECHVRDQIGRARCEGQIQIAICRLCARIGSDDRSDEAPGDLRAEDRSVVVLFERPPTAVRRSIPERVCTGVACDSEFELSRRR